jgi:hypothetical protein
VRRRLPIGDFSHLKDQVQIHRADAAVDFLDFLADNGRAYPTFKLIMEAR